MCVYTYVCLYISVEDYHYLYILPSMTLELTLYPSW